MAAVSDQPGTCRKERKSTEREVQESGVILALAQRPLGKSLQPTEALQAHKSPEKLRLPGTQR